MCDVFGKVGDERRVLQKIGYIRGQDVLPTNPVSRRWTGCQEIGFGFSTYDYNAEKKGQEK